MRDLIFEKIWNLQTSTPTLKKFFSFTLEDLNDNPEECLKEIEDYLSKHGDKIIDFSFDTWIDEETFRPILMMKMYLVESLAMHVYPSNMFNCLLPSSKEEMLLRERITNLMSDYTSEFNNEDVRKLIVEKLKYILDGVDVIDLTTFENIDKGVHNFIIRHDDNEMALNEYLEVIGDKKRYEGN
jgi:hypothetical protein